MSSFQLELAAYRALTRIAQPAAGLILRMRARRGKEDLERASERYGRSSLVRPAEPLVWLHAASVGETVSVLPLIDGLGTRRPDLHVLLTTGTVTSARLAAGRLPSRVMHQFVPLDSPVFVARFLDHWRPVLAAFTEQELWPNLIVETHARGIPMVLLNGRMSEQSYERWQRRRKLASALLSRFSLVLTQGPTYAERYRNLGAQRVVVAGNLKLDAPPLPVDGAYMAALTDTLGGRSRWLAASTHPGEEAIVSAAHAQLASASPGVCTILAPRHPDRGSAIARALVAQGLRVRRRALNELPDTDTDIYLADTIGELGTLYANCGIAFIGGTLVPHGGQNPIEAVRLGAAVLAGASRSNFEDIFEALAAAGGAAPVRDASTLAGEVASLLADPIRLAARREAGRSALSRLTGALELTLDGLLPLLPEQTRGMSHSAAR